MPGALEHCMGPGTLIIRSSGKCDGIGSVLMIDIQRVPFSLGLFDLGTVASA